ncbi:DNA/RNA nuclease SfsA [Archaeoglobus neptunius]|uniref:DNA/RNA nuclease SfsA n=1 Tax=Archaeoglobus neptunius TaxID=2798580 RepID=UPI00192703A6|nr:DNA/RNA nuclease SfsA [Archaeoglobus neptunius]
MKVIAVPEAIECIILGRLNRFVVEIEIDGRVARAHINNTGRLKELLFRGNRGFCFKTETKKTDYRLFAVKCESGYALIDTQIQMKAFERAIRTIDWLDVRTFVRNVRVDESRIDYLLVGKEEVFAELKSAALKSGDYAMYPDCPTERGRRHVQTLIDLVGEGKKAVIVFIAAVPSVKAFKPNMEADEMLYSLLVEAKKAGVMMKALHLEYGDGFVFLRNPDLPVEI